MAYFPKTTLAMTAVVALSCLACNPKANNGDQQTPPPASSASASQEANAAENASATENSSAASANELAAAPGQTDAAQPAANEFGLVPFPGVQAPTITKTEQVRMTTDAGKFIIEVYPEAAPNAAKRFIQLVNKGFYNDTPIFRVVNVPRPFVAQFGINWRPTMVMDKENCFDDDPSYFQLLPGTLAFAKAGPNTNSTQVFINFADNSPLRDQGFTTFARIVEGMENIKKFKSVGSPDMGLDQEQLWNNGEAYLKSLPEKPTMIQKVEVITEEKAPAQPAGEEKASAQPAKK